MAHVKITASFPEELAARLDKEAHRRELSRSSLLGEVLAQYFRDLETEEFQRQIARVLDGETEEERDEESQWLKFARRQARNRIESEDW